jgi:hypothetical protein
VASRGNDRPHWAQARVDIRDRLSRSGARAESATAELRSEFTKDVELLVLRHQLVVLGRQQPAAVVPAADRAFLVGMG